MTGCSRQQKRAASRAEAKAAFRHAQRGPARCASCGAHTQFPHSAHFVTAAGSILCSCCAEEHPGDARFLAIGHSEKMPPWQADDRRFFAKHPKRRLRLRFAFPGEEVSTSAAMRDPGALEPADLHDGPAFPFVEAAFSSVAAVVPRTTDPLHRPVILAIKVTDVMRLRRDLYGFPAGTTADDFDRYAQQAEAIFPVPTAAEIEATSAAVFAQQLAHVAVAASVFNRIKMEG